MFWLIKIKVFVKCFSKPWRCQKRRYSVDEDYHTKNELSTACVDIIEDLLKRRHHLDEPKTKLPKKNSTVTQTQYLEKKVLTKKDNEELAICYSEHHFK